MKKILILGGKPIGSCELTEAAKMKGLYTIVTDNLSPDESAAKRIADEHWEISTADIDILEKECKENGITAIITGVHEFNIERKIELCEKLSYSQYCTKDQWSLCENKLDFKNLCRKYDIPIAKTYKVDDEIEYPVIVKPVDSSGSRGFSICYNNDDLNKGIELALKFSESGQYLVEEYLQCEACIIHYTAIDGNIIFSGMSDKHSQRLEGGSSVMALQTFPSSSMDRYLANINNKAINMFKSIGVQNGPIWIEAFNDIENNRFVFNEMGYRFGGSMTNYPVKHFYGIDQMELMLANAICEKMVIPDIQEFVPEKSCYCILPIHLKVGNIVSISGMREVEQLPDIIKVVPVHFEGDIIQDWGTAQQVFCYLHVAYNKREELADILGKVKNMLSVKNEEDKEMLFYLFDLKKLGVE